MPVSAYWPDSCPKKDELTADQLLYHEDFEEPLQHMTCV
eukprot:Gb_24586 [translate_table: standard]